MSLNNLTVLTHTHTDCKDLWLPYFDSYQDFFKEAKHIVLINKNSSEIKLKQIIYHENIKHVDRLILGLESIDTDYVIISLEDMFLYDYVLIEEMGKIINIMKTDSSINFTRLIKSGINSSNHFFGNLFKMDKTDFLMSITPTIWDRNYLLSLLGSLKGLTIWELEQNGSFILKKSDVNALYCYNNEPKRGGHHDSNIYPHICSAIFKGKWNLREYKHELLPIIKKYNINIYERGIF